MSEQFVTTTKHFRKLLAAGYLLIVLLVGGIICTWLGEWRDLELLERENREINRFRKETHDAYGVWWNCHFWASRCWNGTIRMWRHTGGNGWRWIVCFAASRAITNRCA